MILTVFKCLHFGKYPGDPKEMFRLSSCTYSLRSNDILSATEANTTSYGLQYFSYLSAKCWNVLPDNYRTAVEFNHFRKSSYNSIPQIVNLRILLISVCIFVLVISSHKDISISILLL